jgi:hypothetical protein
MQGEQVREINIRSFSTNIFSGRKYAYVSAFMEGILQRSDGSTGKYSVPLELLYPLEGWNGISIVDIENSALASMFRTPKSVSYGRTMLTDGHIASQGYAYVSVHWDKQTSDNTRIGKIERATDGWLIIKEAAKFARNPSEFSISNAPQDLAVPTFNNAKVIGLGLSQTGMLLRKFYLDGRNADGTFDGSLILGAGGRCLDITDNPPYLIYKNQEIMFPENEKVIAINTESCVDMIAGWFARAQTPGYRIFEIAGVSYLPKPVFPLPLPAIGVIRQNPIDTRPVIRSMLENLCEWIVDNKPPPESTLLLGRVVDSEPLFDSTEPWGSDEPFRFSFERDEEGNAMGGVRMPHMNAPLGKYAGCEDNILRFRGSFFVRFCGSFEAYNNSKLRQLYPSHDIYVDKVTKGAELALQNRWILKKDADAYIEEAKNSSIGR